MLELLLSRAGESPPLDLTTFAWKSLGGNRYGFHHDVVKWNNQLYWIGGTNGTPQTLFARWNGTGWTALPALPTARSGHTSAVVGDKLYVCGGQNAGGTAHTTLVQCYDFVAGTWTTKAPLPSTQCYGDGCAIGTDIYLFGGMTSQTSTPEVPSKFIQYKYDTLTDTWSELTIVGQTPRLDLGVAALDGKIYLIGGRNNSAYINKTFCYDPVTGDMIQKANLLASYGCRRSFVTFDKRLISLWGCQASNGTPYAGTNWYDPVNDAWHALPANASAARGFGGAGFIGNKIYYFSGIKTGTGQVDAWEFSPP